MTDIRRIGDSGIHTVEGMVAGERAAKYAKEREIEQQKYESIKNKIKENHSAKLGRIDEKFSSGK
jgi:protein FAM50